MDAGAAVPMLQVLQATPAAPAKQQQASPVNNPTPHDAAQAAAPPSAGGAPTKALMPPPQQLAGGAAAAAAAEDAMERRLTFAATPASGAAAASTTPTFATPATPAAFAAAAAAATPAARVEAAAGKVPRELQRLAASSPGTRLYQGEIIPPAAAGEAKRAEDAGAPQPSGGGPHTRGGGGSAAAAAVEQDYSRPAAAWRLEDGLPTFPKLVQVFDGVSWCDATIVEAEAQGKGGRGSWRAKAHYSGWNSRFDCWVQPGQVRPCADLPDARVKSAASAETLAAGDEVELRINRSWWPAKVKAVSASSCTLVFPPRAQKPNLAVDLGAKRVRKCSSSHEFVPVYGQDKAEEPAQDSQSSDAADDDESAARFPFQGTFISADQKKQFDDAYTNFGANKEPHRWVCVGTDAQLRAFVIDSDKAEQRDANGWSCLHWASFAGKMQHMRTLFAAGADINAQSKNGDSALHMACRQNNVEVFQLLLEFGAHPTLKNERGKLATQLHRGSNSALFTTLSESAAQRFVKAQGAETPQVGAGTKEAVPSPSTVKTQNAELSSKQQLVGKWIKVEYTDDPGKTSFYTGVVKKYDPKGDRHLVEWVIGGEDWLKSLKPTEYEVLKDRYGPAPNAPPKAQSNQSQAAAAHAAPSQHSKALAASASGGGAAPARGLQQAAKRKPADADLSATSRPASAARHESSHGKPAPGAAVKLMPPPAWSARLSADDFRGSSRSFGATSRAAHPPRGAATARPLRTAMPYASPEKRFRVRKEGEELFGSPEEAVARIWPLELGLSDSVATEFLQQSLVSEHARLRLSFESELARELCTAVSSFASACSFLWSTSSIKSMHDAGDGSRRSQASTIARVTSKFAAQIEALSRRQAIELSALAGLERLP